MSAQSEAMKIFSKINADLLRDRRKAKGMSQNNFAREIGVAQATVSAWERGTQEPHPEAIKKIAAILDVSASEILRTTQDAKKGIGSEYPMAPEDEDLERDFYRGLEVIVSTMSPASADKIQSAVQKIVGEWSPLALGKERPDTDRNVLDEKTVELFKKKKIICALCKEKVYATPKGSCEICGLDCKLLKNHEE